LARASRRRGHSCRMAGSSTVGHGSAETSVRDPSTTGEPEAATAAIWSPAPAGWAAAPSSCSMPAPRWCPSGRRPRCGGCCAKRWGPEQAGPRPCATIPTGVISGCARRSPRPMASIPLPCCLGNGAAELFTWAARDAAATGTSWLPTPGFARLPPRPGLLGRVVASPCPCRWGARSRPQGKGAGAVTVTMRSGSPIPHNPTGQLWSRSSLEPLLERFAPGDRR